MSLSRKLSFALFVAVLVAMTGASPRARAQFNPTQSRWLAVFPNFGYKCVDFQPYTTFHNGTMVGRFTLQGQFAGGVPFVRTGEFVFIMTGPSKAFIQARYDDNGQIEQDAEHLCNGVMNLFDMFGGNTVYIKQW
jgi:hypothetical protein